jgi:hypothetical protein
MNENRLKIANIRITLLWIYLTVIVVLGILFVPVKAVWGPEKEIYNLYYVPLWLLKKARYTINGYALRYELYIDRAFYELAIVTLIFGVIYILWKEISLAGGKDSKRPEESVNSEEDDVDYC